MTTTKPTVQEFNAAIELFDELTGYCFDRVTDLAYLATLARIKGWPNIAETIAQFNGQ